MKLMNRLSEFFPIVLLTAIFAILFFTLIRGLNYHETVTKPASYRAWVKVTGKTNITYQEWLALPRGNNRPTSY